MKKYIIYLITVLVIGIIYGISIHKYKIFPYEYLRKAYEFSLNGNVNAINDSVNNFTSDNKNYIGPWSIGIYMGSTPFDLTDPEHISNPIITAKDIFDVDAQFIADPFMVVEDSSYYIFFEVLNRENDQGDIGYAESKDAMEWRYRGVILNENFHLSYPHVFKWNGDYYMIPESNEDLSVRAYKAVSFPNKWEYVGNLLNGFHFVDPTVFHYKNKWWMFISNTYNDALNLFYSDNLLNGWKAHPLNPIVKNDMNISRPAGRVIIDNGHLYRFAQDDDPDYGIQVFAFEITDLSETSYKEKILENPVVKMSGEGWNAVGMHHVDLQKVGDKWIAAVDGREK